jgi:hypothetical protein
MDNLLHHPLRVALILTGFLCALLALTFFGGGAAAMMIPYIAIILRFIGSPQKSLVVTGWLLLFLMIISLCVRRIEIDGFRFENHVILGGPLLLLFAGLHLLVSESRKKRTSNAK